MISSVSWCLPMVATAVFQTAIIILGLKSQKVQARSKRMLSFLHPRPYVVLHVLNPKRLPQAFVSPRQCTHHCTAGILKALVNTCEEIGPCRPTAEE